MLLRQTRPATIAEAIESAHREEAVKIALAMTVENFKKKPDSRELFAQAAKDLTNALSELNIAKSVNAMATNDQRPYMASSDQHPYMASNDQRPYTAANDQRSYIASNDQRPYGNDHYSHSWTPRSNFRGYFP